MTRGSLRSRQSSWPWPTSSAMTSRAPRCSSTSVKPPVDAPMSSALRPVDGDAEHVERVRQLERRRGRHTDGRALVSVHVRRLRPTGVPALRHAWPSTRTWPARISARARSRDGDEPALDEQQVEPRLRMSHGHCGREVAPCQLRPLDDPVGDASSQLSVERSALVERGMRAARALGGHALARRRGRTAPGRSACRSRRPCRRSCRAPRHRPRRRGCRRRSGTRGRSRSP